MARHGCDCRSIPHASYCNYAERDGVESSVYCTHIRRRVFGQAISCDDCGHVIVPEPTSPSVETVTNRDGQVVETSQGRSLSYGPSICTQCARHKADAERLAKENRELKEKLAEYLLPSGWPRRIHGS